MSTNTISTPEEYVPGMREQGKGVKIYVEHMFRPLKACIVGNAEWIYLPDADFSAIANLLADNSDEEMKNYLREHAGKNLKDADPEMYAKCKAESDALGPVAEGVIGVPTGGPGPCFWTPFPDELKDWEIIDIEWDEHKIDAGNCVIIDEKKVAIPAEAVKFAEEISKRGYEPVQVPYSNITHMTGSGIQCSTLALWRG